MKPAHSLFSLVPLFSAILPTRVLLLHQVSMSDDGARPPTTESNAEVPQQEVAVATTSVSPQDVINQLEADKDVALQKVLALNRELNSLDHSTTSRRRHKEIADAIDLQMEQVTRLEGFIALQRKAGATTGRAGATTPPAASPAALSVQQQFHVPKDLPKFRFGTAAIDIPEKFFGQFQRVLSGNGLDLDMHGRRLLLLCLAEDHASWVERNLAPTLSWSDIKAAFTRQFDDPRRVERLRMSFARLRMSPSETLEEFALRFENHMVMANVSDTNELAVSAFCNALPRELFHLVALALRQSDDTATSVKEIIRIAASFAWEPAGAAPPSSRGKAGRVDNSARPKVGSRHHCQRHGWGMHSTSQCRVLNARKNRSGSKDAGREPAVASSPTSSHANSSVSVEKAACYTCNKPGHFAASCPQKKTTSTSERPVAKLANIISARRAERSPAAAPASAAAPAPTAAPPLVEPADVPPILVPALLNGQEELVQLDTGASRSLISTNLASRLGASIEPREGAIRGINATQPLQRVGITSPIHIQLGPLDIRYRCEVVSELDDAQFLCGNDLIQRIGLDGFGLPFRFSNQTSAADAPIERPIQLIKPDFSTEEQSASYQRYRDATLQPIQQYLVANAAIPRASFCTIPEAEVQLCTEPGTHTFARQFPLPEVQHPWIAGKLKEWLRDGVIERVTTRSIFNTPFFLAPKKDPTGAKSDFRICHDFRKLNQLLPNDAWPLPLISEIFMALSGAMVFSTLDLHQAYHRFPIAPADRHKTAFTWNDVQYQFCGAPFGLKTLPSHFQRVMSMLFDGLDFVRVFIDDIVVFSKSRDEHATHLAEVIRRLNDAQLILNVDKCHFVRLEVNLLGFRIDPYGRSIDPSRLANIVDWPTPTTAKQLQSFLGVVNYLREHVPMIATITAPLNAIRTNDNIPDQWTSECARAFLLLKDMLPQCPPLAHPDFGLPFCVATDASAVGMGAVLYQHDPQTDAPRYISFQARSLSSSERNYSATKRELLAVVFALQRFHQFVYGRHFTLYTDHRALVHLHTQPRLNAMMQSWYDTLFNYNFSVWHRPGIQNILPDCLSRLFPPSSLEGEDTSVNIAANTNAMRQRSTAVALKTATYEPQPSYMLPAPDARADIILQHHLRGHFGVKATIDAIHESGYDWSNLAAQVRDVCAKCLPCQRHNITKRGYHPLSSISADQPLDHLAIDLAGPFPTSPRANHYLLIVVCVHSRFVVLRAIPDKQMTTVCAALFDIFTTFGFPKIVQSDNGTEFVNSAIRQLFDSGKVDHRLVTPYHPRANGVAERTVQTAVSTIKKMLDGAQHDWDLTVPFVQYAINTKVAAIHNSTPFAVLFGRSANQFADFSAATDSPATDADVQARVQFMQEALFPGIADLARSTQNAKKSSFDAKHQLVDFPIGAHVVVRNIGRRKKLDPRFEGPFEVVGKEGNAYSLQDNSGALLPHRFPPSALKLISSDPVYLSESYEVDAIINHREINHAYEYLVRWKNYSPEHDSWEPATNFDDEATIIQYWRRRQSLSTRTPSAGRE